MIFKDRFLETGEWVPETRQKVQIFLHHTAGGHRPDWTIDGWNRTGPDKKRTRIATAFVIGGRSIRDGNSDWDGVILRAFPEGEWAYHLGVKGTRGRLDKASVGIEICNYGPIRQTRAGAFLNYVNSTVPESDVVELDRPFRGSKLYHGYTDRQLESLSGLLELLSEQFQVDLNRGLKSWRFKEGLALPPGLSILDAQRWLNRHGFVGKDGRSLDEDGVDGPNTRAAIGSVGRSAFENNDQALAGAPGLWTHTNVRKDKSDCSPQKGLLGLIDSLA